MSGPDAEEQRGRTSRGRRRSASAAPARLHPDPPDPAGTDRGRVLWHGPFFIPRSGEWWPPTDALAFEAWYHRREWSGTHPWEIVFAHPHGILLSPYHDAGTWRFFLGVDALGLYGAAARMAIALAAAGVPFDLVRAVEVVATLRGEDWIEIGPFRGQMTLDEAEERRPGATSRVVWDDSPRLVAAR